MHAYAATLLISCVVILAARPASTQTGPVRVLGSTHVSSDARQSPFAESHIAINPRNPRNLIATAIVIERNATRSAVYATFDGGKTWERSKPVVAEDSIFEGGDPVVYFDGAGGAWFSTLQGGFRVSRSSDGGRSWARSVVLPGGGFDRQWLAFDNTGGRYHGRVYGAGYLTNTSHLNGSMDRSLGVVVGNVKDSAWRTAAILNNADTSDFFFVPGDAIVTPTGRLVIPYNSFQFGVGGDSARQGHIWAVASDNGASEFHAARKVGPLRQRGRGFDSYKLLGPVRATVDTSRSSYRGRIYLAWIDLEGSRHTVVVSYSADNGTTWSTPVSIRDRDAQQDPATPALAVNKDGVLALSFYDRRADARNACYELYVTASLDGGETFLPNVKASDGVTCPTAPGNWGAAAFGYLQPALDRVRGKAQAAIALMVVPSRWPNGGDTQGIVADADGTFHAGWVNGASGVMQLWATQFRVDAKAVATKPSTGAEEDHTEEVRFLLSNPIIDFAKRVMSVEAQLENISAAAIRGPFTAKLTEISESLPGLQATNADNGLGGVGATWRFEAGDGKSLLEPGQKSARRVLRFAIDGTPPEKPSDPLRALFRISSVK